MTISDSEVERRYAILCQKYDMVKDMVKLCGVTSLYLDDVVQDVMIAAYGGIGKLYSLDKIDGWLFAIVKDKTRKTFEKIRQRRIMEIHLSSSEWMCLQVDVMELEVPKIEDCEFTDERIRELVNSLKPPAPEIITLRFVAGFSLRQISEMLQTNQNTVRSIEFRGLRKLKELMTENSRIKEK